MREKTYDRKEMFLKPTNVFQTFLKLMFIIVGWFVFVSTTPMIIYNNAQFYVTGVRSRLTALFPITTQNNCICQCYANTSCITGNFFGFNQTCVLFSAHLQQGQLLVMTTNKLASVFSFPNKTVSFGKSTKCCAQREL
jgi:hypothetical protein